jgi:hypothetical protein
LPKFMPNFMPSFILLSKPFVKPVVDELMR